MLHILHGSMGCMFIPAQKFILYICQTTVFLLILTCYANSDMRYPPKLLQSVYTLQAIWSGLNLQGQFVYYIT